MSFRSMAKKAPPVSSRTKAKPKVVNKLTIQAFPIYKNDQQIIAEHYVNHIDEVTKKKMYDYFGIKDINFHLTEAGYNFAKMYGKTSKFKHIPYSFFLNSSVMNHNVVKCQGFSDKDWKWQLYNMQSTRLNVNYVKNFQPYPFPKNSLSENYSKLNLPPAPRSVSEFYDKKTLKDIKVKTDELNVKKGIISQQVFDDAGKIFKVVDQRAADLQKTRISYGFWAGCVILGLAMYRIK